MKFTILARCADGHEQTIHTEGFPREWVDRHAGRIVTVFYSPAGRRQYDRTLRDLRPTHSLHGRNRLASPLLRG